MSDKKNANYRIEVSYLKEDPRGKAFEARFKNLGFNIKKISITDNYLLNVAIPEQDIESVAQMLTQPVTQKYNINKPYMPDDFDFCIEIGFLPGVTDNVAYTVRESLEDLYKKNFNQEKSVFYTTSYFITGLTEDVAIKLGRELYNPLIQRIKILSKDQYISEGGFGKDIPLVTISEGINADIVELNVPNEELLKIGKEGILEKDGSRRGPLALDILSMNAIKEYFCHRENRNPKDIEIESIAQTWSEHCKHTIFASALDDDTPEGIYKTYIREATKRIRREKGEKDFCVSVFTDNSGGIDFDENFIISDKVETHNSPSALDPFGGAITGIVGVNRDSIGFGMGAKPIANRFGFCFADPSDDSPLYKNKSKDSQLLPPRRIMEGVIHGVNAGGNTSGIPTPQGFVYFDERYKGKPLVFVGTIGLIPKKTGRSSSVKKSAMPGDRVVMVGGRVGRDGIHGATFSSESLNSGSPATAVQIGDPITQKKFSDVIVKEARDMGLYNSITDNGAGGLSCSVSEMARECGGFTVDLEKIPLKYPGLSPWQIWISESQERMTLAVPENKIAEFNSLMKKRGVESTIIGTFNSTNRGIVRFNGKEIFNLDMNFLHDGLPKRNLKTKKTKKNLESTSFKEPSNYTEVFHEMLARLNVCSFEFISTQYDHEVQGNSVTKPIQGRGRVNANVSIIRPLLNSNKGVVLSQGMYPSYGDVDMYWMAACSIDTAIRNIISGGGSMDHLAILDNFCWCDSHNPERLWQLKNTAKACYDFSVDYGTPFISGKDSMFNDFHGYDKEMNEVKISIPPTLLISSIGVIRDIKKSQTLDFKFPGDLIYIIGDTKEETGGSEYNALIGEKERGRRYVGSNVPTVNSDLNKKIYRAMEKAIEDETVTSCISIEKGGLGVALAKSSIGGLTGAEIKLSQVPLKTIMRNDFILFSETQGRFIVSVNPKLKDSFETHFNDLPIGMIGKVRDDEKFIIYGVNEEKIVETNLNTNNYYYKKTLKNY